MDWKAVRDTARSRLEGFCRVCATCNGRACAGQVPGMGGLGTGASFEANLHALQARQLNLRALHGVTEARTATRCFGLDLETPLHIAPMTGVTYNMGGALTESEFIEALVTAAEDAGSLCWTGDGADPTMFDSGLEAIAAHGGRGAPVIKPRAQDEIIARIRRAEEAGAVAVGVDIDGAGLITMAQFGQPVGPKTPQEIKALVESTELPFFVKGVMTVDEAKAAADVGCAAIVVSNHGGRVLDHTPGVAEVLPAIAEAVGKDLTILADGGVRHGSDVLKLLALGAHAVLMGRPFVPVVFGGGAEAATALLQKTRTELVQAMLLTGNADVNAVRSDTLYN